MNDKFNPLVSIVIPVYNGENYMREAINSALAQTYKNVEVLVINDGSNDGGKTKEIAESYGNKIRYFEKENGGVATALNLGIQEMKGEYFSWLSHDDVYDKNKINTQIEAFLGYGIRDAIFYTDYFIIDKKGLIVGNVVLDNFASISSFPFDLYINHILHGCSLLIPKEAFSRIDKFDEELITTQDYDLWMKMSEKYQFIHIPKMLISSRRHEEQGSINIRSHRNETNIFFDKYYGIFTKDWLVSNTTISPFRAYKELEIVFYIYRINPEKLNSFIREQLGGISNFFLIIYTQFLKLLLLLKNLKRDISIKVRALLPKT